MDDEYTFQDPQFYGAPKVHKDMKNHGSPLYPATSQCGSFLVYISTYMDINFQHLLKNIPSYIKDLGDFIQRLESKKPFLENARLVISNAEAVYVSINLGEEHIAIQRYFKKYKENSHLPFQLLLRLLVQVLRNNSFQFGDTWWLQCTGTAMVTPAACVYTTIFFAYLEQTQI